MGIFKVFGRRGSRGELSRSSGTTVISSGRVHVLAGAGLLRGNEKAIRAKSISLPRTSFLRWNPRNGKTETASWSIYISHRDRVSPNFIPCIVLYSLLEGRRRAEREKKGDKRRWRVKMAIFKKGARRIRTPFENETIQSTSGGLLSTRDSIQPRSRSNATEGTIGGEEGAKKAARGMRPFSLSRSISEGSSLCLSREDNSG